MGEKFRLGLVGIGRVTISCHLPAAVSLPDVEVTAMVDPAVGRMEKVARNYGLGALLTSNVEDILKSVDGVIVATPNHLHAEAACPLLNAGIPALIEKPLAASQQDGRRIVEAAKRSGVIAAMGYCSRFQDNVLFTGKLIQDGYFGQIERFVYQFGSRGGWAPFSAYNLERRHSGGGVVMVTGTHFLDRMLAWFGKPRGIEYYDDGEAGPESNAITCFEFDGRDRPFPGIVRFSKTCSLPPGLVLDTAKGRVVLKEDSSSWPVLKPKDDSIAEMHLMPSEKQRLPETMNVFQRQLFDFVNACSQHREPMVPLSTGLDSLALIENMYGQRKSLSSNWYNEFPEVEAVSQ